MLEYYVHVENFSYEFMSLVSEALGLGPHELDALFDADRSKLQPRGKLLCYPPADPGAEGVQSGIEAHTDKSVLTYVCTTSILRCQRLLIATVYTVASSSFRPARTPGPEPHGRLGPRSFNQGNVRH
jgi:hypothetical protein